MLKRVAFLFMLMWMAFSGFAQNRSNIKGKVIDSLSKEPMEFATVAVLNVKDTTSSSLIAYTVTDKTGAFALHNLPAGIALKVLITFVTYQPCRKFITLDKLATTDFGVIAMSQRNLKEVSINAERPPIIMNKDTIEFNAEAFKTRPNAVVEDLLKKLPGVEVDNYGKITVMGKKVNKILVDGHEFFPSDPRIATKNLDADLIDKVQVYDDHENDPDNLIPPSRANKIINLKFKKALKKSAFGKVYGGLGTQNHYQTGGLFNFWRDTLQVSVLGLTNNLNNTGFDFIDLYSNGGMNRGGDAFQRGGFGGSAARGQQTVTTGGININTDYGKKLKLNLAYLVKRTIVQSSTITNRQQFLADTIATTYSANNSTSYATSHNISSTVSWRPNGNTTLRYSPGLNVLLNNTNSSYGSNSFSNFINPLNSSVNGSTSSGNNLSFQQSLSYNHQLKKKGSSINLDHSFSISPGRRDNAESQVFTSNIATFPSFILKQEGQNINKSIYASIAGSYRTPINKKLVADISLSADYSNQSDRASTYDYNPTTGEYDSFLIMKSSDLTRIKWTQSVNPGISYSNPKTINFSFHVGTQFQKVNNIFNRNTANLNQFYVNFLPTASFNYKNLSASYSRNVQLPNISDMIPYNVVFSPLYSVTGNANLKPTKSNNFGLSFSKSNYQTGNNFNINANATFEQNSIFRQRTISPQLVETSTPVNRDGRRNFNINTYFTKNIKRQKGFRLYATTNLTGTTSHDFFVLNRLDGYQDSYQANFSESFSLNYKDVIQLDPKYSLAYTYTNYSGVNYASQNNLSHNVDAHFTIFFPQKLKFNIEGNYGYNYNSLVAPGFQKSSNLLNLNLAHQFLNKDRGEIKLACYDILNQSISTYRYFGVNSITDNQSQIIKRYFMLTLQFKFNRSSFKEKAKPALGPLK